MSPTVLPVEWTSERSWAARGAPSSWLHQCGGARVGRARPTIFRALGEVQHGLISADCQATQGVYVGEGASYGTWGHACEDGHTGRVEVLAVAVACLRLTCRRCGHAERVGIECADASMLVGPVENR